MALGGAERGGRRGCIGGGKQRAAGGGRAGEGPPQGRAACIAKGTQNGGRSVAALALGWAVRAELGCERCCRESGCLATAAVWLQRLPKQALLLGLQRGQGSSLLAAAASRRRVSTSAAVFSGIRAVGPPGPRSLGGGDAVGAYPPHCAQARGSREGGQRRRW